MRLIRVKNRYWRWWKFWKHKRYFYRRVNNRDDDALPMYRGEVEESQHWEPLKDVTGCDV